MRSPTRYAASLECIARVEVSVSYCPKCHHEYAETVANCIDCGSKLRAGNRPIDTSLGLSDTLVPVGAAICGFIAFVLLYLRLTEVA